MSISGQLAEFESFIQSGDYCFNDLNENLKNNLKNSLCSTCVGSGFNDEQREFLYHYNLQISKDTISEMNDILPEKVELVTFDHSGNSYINFDVLTDSFDTNGLYFPVNNYLQSGIIKKICYHDFI